MGHDRFGRSDHGPEVLFIDVPWRCGLVRVRRAWT
jgi:hypothetical protein